MAHAVTAPPPDTSSGVKLQSGTASSISGFSEKTLSRMADRGELTVTYTPGGHRRYLEVEIRAIAKGGAA